MWYNKFGIFNVLLLTQKKGEDNMANVLVVDDTAFMRMQIKQILVKEGHSMIGEAENGIEAVEQFQKLKPDVVILDITMPKMDGIEALKKIKEIDPDSKVIICSAVGYQEMLAKAMQCGAETFIVEPFEAEHLIKAVNKVMG